MYLYHNKQTKTITIFNTNIGDNIYVISIDGKIINKQISSEKFNEIDSNILKHNQPYIIIVESINKTKRFKFIYN